MGLGALGFEPQVGVRVRALTGTVSPYVLGKAALGIAFINSTRMLRAGAGVEYRHEWLGLYGEAAMEWDAFCDPERSVDVCDPYTLMPAPQITVGANLRF